MAYGTRLESSGLVSYLAYLSEKHGHANVAFYETSAIVHPSSNEVLATPDGKAEIMYVC